MGTQAAVTVTDTAALIRAAEAAVQERVFERNDEIHMIFVALLAKQHAKIYGPPGTGKTFMLETIARCFAAKFTHILMHKQLGEDAIFGQHDVAQFMRGGPWERDITDTLADCHIALLDELDKTGPTNVNPTLTAMEGRKYRPGKHWVNIPLISVVGSLNADLEEGLQAFDDRFAVNLVVDYIQSPAVFSTFLLRTGIPVPLPSVPIEVLLDAIERVPDVTVEQRIIDLLIKLRGDMRRAGIVLSDRRWEDGVSLLQANAWLDGRTEVIDDDLEVLCHVLWTAREQRDKIRRLVLEHTSPYVKLGLEFSELVAELEAAMDDMAGKSGDEQTQFAARANHRVKELTKRLVKQIQKARGEGRSTARLEALRPQLLDLGTRLYQDCMGLSPDAARMAATDSLGLR